MEYTYRLTVLEAFGCSVRYAFRDLLRNSRWFRGVGFLWLASLGLWGMTAASHFLSSETAAYWEWMTEPGMYVVPWLIGLWLLVAYVRALVRVYGDISQISSRKKRRVVIADGIIQVEGMDGWKRYRCREILEIRRWGRMYWISVTGYRGAKRWLFLPFRVVGSAAERKQFERWLEEQRRLPGEIPECMWREPDRGNALEYRIAFQWNFDAMVQMLVEGDWIRKCFLPKTRRGTQGKILPVSSVVSFLKNVGPEVYEEPVEYQIDEGGILRRTPLDDQYYKWNELAWLLESDMWYHLYPSSGKRACVIPKDCFGDWMGQKLWIQKCQERGLKHVEIGKEIAQISGGSSYDAMAAQWAQMREEPDSEKGKGRIVLAAVVGLVLLAVFLPDLSDRSSIPLVLQEDGKEMYERYVPLDEQVKVLGELGFHWTEERLQELKQSLEEESSYRIWVEGYPYTVLINVAAYPEYDMENWEIISYSEQAYWFDWEGFDLEEDYCDILRGLEAMSGGELQITELAVDDSKVNWEQGSGTLSIAFAVNGIAQVSKVRVENDWLDADFLDDVRGALKAAGITEKQLYSMDDNGQGCILLYRTPDWAKEFTEKTGIILQ